MNWLCSYNIVLIHLDSFFQINEERNGKQFQQDLLKQVMTFFLETGGEKRDYYEAFEQIMLEDAASYYSQLASKLLCGNSSTDYIQKVDFT